MSVIKELRAQSIEWSQPKYPYSIIKEAYQKIDKPLKLINVSYIVFPAILGLLAFLFWSTTGTLIGRQIGYINAILICIGTIIVLVIILHLNDYFISSNIITLRDGFIFHNRTGRNLKQWKPKDIIKLRVNLIKVKDINIRFLELITKNKKQFYFIIDESISSTRIEKFCDIYEINYEELSL